MSRKLSNAGGNLHSLHVGHVVRSGNTTDFRNFYNFAINMKARSKVVSWYSSRWQFEIKKKKVTITKLSNAIAMIATVIGWYKKGTQLFTRKRRAQPSNYSWSSIAVLVSVSIYFFILFYVPFEISPSPLCCQSNCVVRIKATNN